MNRSLIAWGACLAFLGVALGAFGTHALSKTLDAHSMDIWRTGVQYHQVHAVAIVLAGLLSAQIKHPFVVRAGWAFVIGIAIFGGSLYALAITGVKWLGAITPLGGVAFLTGWGLIAVAALKSPSE